MEMMHRTKVWENGAELLSPLGAHHSPQISGYSPTQELSRTPPVGFLWRLRYTGMTDQITGHC